jgi:hypothetical protein
MLKWEKTEVGKDALVLSEMRVDPARVAETDFSLLQLKIKPGGSHGNISHAFIFKHSRSPPPAHQLKIILAQNSYLLLMLTLYLCQVR